MDPYIGKMLDNRYEILERIGTGGMAVVYKAMCHRLNRLVAVKILRSDLAQDEEFRRRFNAESQAVAQLSSPNIVSVYDVSRGGDTEYIIMELVDGITLKQYMESRGQLSWRESLHFITQIMRGLSCAHAKGIVHRDIKPQNIMVMRDSSVKVADFGIACLENSSQTLTQQALGSVHYISPEQARGERTDARSDIYSAGVVLYEMLTGRLPFEGESAVSVALQHLSSIPPDPREINPDIPEQIELICLKAMAPELDRRYASAEAMIRDLEAFREDPEVRLDFSMEDLRPDVVDEPTRPMALEPVLESYDPSARRQRPVPEEELPLWQSVLPGEKVRLFTFLGVALLALVVAVVLLRAIFRPLSQEPVQEQYLVKNVVGYTLAQARELDGVKDIFDITAEGEVYSDEYPRGTIVRQDPEPDRYRKGRNLVIHVWVSSGEETVYMPNVVNQTVEQAESSVLRQLIERLDLTLLAAEEDAIYSDSYEEGVIISSIPREGEELHRGDTIRLFLSKGPHTWPLASFVGMKLETVKGQLDNLHLLWDIIGFAYSDEEFGTILSQEPEAFTQVRDGTKVRFLISRGPETPAVPETPVVNDLPVTTGEEAGGTEDASTDVGIPPVEEDPPTGSDTEADSTDGEDSGNDRVSSGGEAPLTDNREPAETHPLEEDTSGQLPPVPTDGDGQNSLSDGADEVSEETPAESPPQQEEPLSASATSTRRIILSLPDDRLEGYLEVLQDGRPVMTGTVLCGGAAYPLDVTGHGETHVTAYLDGEELYNSVLLIGEDS